MSSAIHDLGYKRYVGTRRSTGARWRVIARQQMATAWKAWWRWKLVGVCTLVPLVVAAVFIFVVSDKLFGSLSRAMPFTFADVALPFTYSGFCFCAFIASLVIGATIIAGDVQSGAFVFYFARSTRPGDYLVGKLAGYGTVIASVMVAGPTLVAIMRLALTSTRDAVGVAHQLAIVPEAIGLGLVATLAYTAIPLGFSALFARRGYALGMWAAFYLVLGSIAAGIGVRGDLGWLAALDISTALTSLAHRAFQLPSIFGDASLQISVAASLISIGAQSAIALALVYWRLATAQKAGVGGAT